MAGINGTSVLVIVNVGSEASPVWVAVGSQRSFTRNENRAEIDLSSKDSIYGEFEAGRYDSTVDLDALYVPGQQSYQTIRQALRNGLPIQLRVQEQGTDTEQANARVLTIAEEFPDQEAATTAVSFRVTGGWVPAS